jgi:MYXO-CTERM domain-containing protein
MRFPRSKWLPRMVAIGVVIGAALRARDAGAFCRMVTEATPPDWNSAVLGCFKGESGDKELYWKNVCVGYSLQKDASNQVTLEQATEVAHAAFAAWNATTCDGGGHPSIGATDMGPVDCGRVQYYQDRPNQHVIAFRDDMWPHDDPNNTVGLTTLTFDVTTGEIFDADMELNSSQHILSVGGVPTGGLDLQSVITHEAGHFLGLAHADQTNAIMFAHYRGDSPDLQADDTAGICAIYAPDGTRSTSGGPLAGEACNETPRHGFTSECDPPASVVDGSSGGSKGCTMAGGELGGGQGTWALLAAGGVFAARRRRNQGARRARLFTALWLAIAAASPALMTTTDARASVSIAVLFGELVQRATGVAVVTPVEQHATWEEGRIYTYTRVRVDSLAAGELPEGTWVRTMGGKVGNIGQLVEGEAVLTMGRPTLLFLEPVRSPGAAGVFEVTARGQGQFVVAPRAEGGPQILRSYAGGALAPPSQERLARFGGTVSAGDPALRLARDVLHQVGVDEAARIIAGEFSVLHAK